MVGILTFYWADDYGAMLQAYALKRQLELLGTKAEIISYAPCKLTGRYWLCPVCAEFQGERLHYYVHRHLFKAHLVQGADFWKRRHRMRRFRREYLTASPPVRDVKQLFLGKYEVVFIGSDQVWNPDITVDLDDAYIGNIPDLGNCRLAAYGASLGGRTLSEAEERKFVQYVSRLSAISLREQTDAARVGQLLGRKVYDVLDPVLLLERTEWRTTLPGEEDYILIHLTQYHEELLSCARALAAQLGKKIISLSNLAYLEGAPAGSFQDVEIRSGCGPMEFLGYIQNAFCVLTNSFHAAAFSVLMEKGFLAFRHSTRSVRLEDLLCKLGLSSHMARPVSPDAAMDLWERTDWKSVRACLEEEREKSNCFIRKALLADGGKALEQL